MSKKKNALPPDQDQRALILTELGSNMLVEAAAGTGKTTAMVARMVALLSTGECTDIRTLSAVTFTRKAAAELRGRFQIALEQAVRKSRGEDRARLERALGRIEQCYVGTIHSFCGRLLRERPIEAGVDLAFTEIEPEEDVRLRRQAWSEFGTALLSNDPDGLLVELDQLGLPMKNLEGTFVNFADYPDVDEWPSPEPETAAIDMNRARKKLDKYLAHMDKLFPKLPTDWGNDKLIPAYRNLPQIASHYDLTHPAQMMDLLARFNNASNLVQKEWKKTGAFTAEDSKEELVRWLEFREEVVTPLLQQWAERRYGPLMSVMARGRVVYDKLRRQKGQLNYQDLLTRAAALLRQGPHVREYFARRFTHLLVDEFHDTDPIQADVMLLLTATDPGENNWRKCAPRPGSLFVVGDPKQSIYRFRRADIVTYNEVNQIIGRHGLITRLSANFRSSQPIIEWVNEVFESSADEEDKESDVMLRFERANTEQSPAYVPLQVGRSGKPMGPLKGIYRLEIPGDLNQKEAIPHEADLIARTIRKALDAKALPGDFMIVTYNKKRLSRYGQALQEYGIPHQVTGGAALNEVPELKLLHTCLQAVVRPDDPVLLVAALRSELFGVSDAALYAFKKAGGRFSMHSDVPSDLAEEHSVALSLALERLGIYSRWVSTLPRIAAFEKVLGDLGLLMRASTRLGGNVEAGSLAKAMEILRAADRDSWTAAEVVDYLGELVGATEQHDGVSARPEDRSVVRVMNLHKVKGLEAPVVFLACPYGENDFSPDKHIDRSGEKIVGYMKIAESNGYQSRPVAQPAGWEQLQARETEFDRAEKLRLRYVAATRAGQALIVSRFDGTNTKNPWQYFEPYLADHKCLPDPGEQAAPAREQISITKTQVKKSAAEISGRLAASSQATYDLQAAKTFALSKPSDKKRSRSDDTPPEAAPVSEGEHGVEWGSVIHRLLEVAMEDPKADLRHLAEALLAEHEINASHAESAIETVESVIKSDIWQRALKSDQRYSEIPFQVLLDTKDNIALPTVVRGSIDLVFKEKDGWVIIDYKTDTLTGRTAQDIADKYAPQVKMYADAWMTCTGEKVQETGVLIVRTGEVVGYVL